MKENENTQYGVINEVGDIGLGFDEVTEEENVRLNESDSTKKEEDK